MSCFLDNNKIIWQPQHVPLSGQQHTMSMLTTKQVTLTTTCPFSGYSAPPPPPLQHFHIKNEYPFSPSALPHQKWIPLLPFSTSTSKMNTPSPLQHFHIKNESHPPTLQNFHIKNEHTPPFKMNAHSTLQHFHLKNEDTQISLSSPLPHQKWTHANIPLFSTSTSKINTPPPFKTNVHTPPFSTSTSIWNTSPSPPPPFSTATSKTTPVSPPPHFHIRNEHLQNEYTPAHSFILCLSSSKSCADSDFSEVTTKTRIT